VIALLAHLSTVADAAEVTRRAVVVGVNNGGSGLEPLRYAEDDALRVAGVLRELGDFGPTDVTVLLQPDVTTVRETIAGLSFDEADERMLLFYYSGHADSAGLRLGTEVLPWDDLKETLREVDATVTLGVLDACRAGAITRTKGASVAAPFLVERGLEAEGEAWIAASSDDEQAQESDAVGASYFTHFFVSGLRGAADTGDGQVSLSEAYFYAENRTVARTAGSEAGAQHPAYQFQISGNGDLVLTDLHDASARLSFPADSLPAEITVLSDPTGVSVADVLLVPGRPTALAVAPGRYRLIRHDSDGLGEVRVFVDAGATLTVDRWGVARAVEGVTKGADDAAIDERKPWISIRTEDSTVRFELDLPDDIQLPKWSLTDKPGIAAPLSAILPGAGQAYSGRWPEATLFFTGFALTSGLGWGATVTSAGPNTPATHMIAPNPISALGLFVWGWSAFDAGRAVAKDPPDYTARRGVTISYEAAWTDDVLAPSASGFAVDAWFLPWMAAGLDRSGWVPISDTEGRVHTGGRLLIGPQLGPVQAYAIGAAGAAVPTVTVPDDVQIRPAPEPIVLLPTLGAGGALRVYATPRWFLELQARSTWTQTSDGWGAPPALQAGLGLGTKLFTPTTHRDVSP
jgi:hypothetical protein